MNFNSSEKNWAILKIYYWGINLYVVSEYNFIEVISIKYLINNIEFVISTCISVLAIIVSAIVAKNILKKELQESRKLELELKNAEILQQVRNYKNTLVIRQIDNMIEICFEIIDYLNEIESLKLSNKPFYLLEDISKIPTMIKRYDLFRKFVTDYRLNTINKCKHHIKEIKKTIGLNF